MASATAKKIPEKVVAENVLGMKRSTLAYLRKQGKGPAATGVVTRGKFRVMYSEDALRRWIHEQRDEAVREALVRENRLTQTIEKENADA